MLKIEYPSSLVDFKSDYLSIFGEVKVQRMQAEYDLLCQAPNLSTLRGVELKDILTGDFDFLLDLGLKYLSASPTDDQETDFNDLFNYDKPKISTKQQPKISEFFVRKSTSLKVCTCYFCNIDFINAFSDGADYNNYCEFINNAPDFELSKIRGISEELAKEIVRYRESLPERQDVTDDGLKSISGLGVKKLEALQHIDFKKQYYHFTLDHVLNKARYPILALSLFNLIPCCYACNSKFKLAQELVTGAHNAFLSPTSEHFSFHEDNSFELFFKANQDEFSHIKSTNDFALRLIPKREHTNYNAYIEMFKLNARYKLHKSDVLELVLQRKRYTDTKIKQLSKLVGGSKSTIKKSLFGHEIFESNLSKKPKTKLLQDIAKIIKII